MVEPGLLVDDRYRLDAPIATGGMGEVWRATDTVLRRTVAVKLLRGIVDETAQARFRSEARAMAALHHPGVADVYDYGETDLPDGTGAAYIAMANVDGEPLSRRIAEAGPLDPAETRSIVAQAARALQAVHDAGVVHRDVKPSNMIVTPGGAVVLIDFGVAVTAGGMSHTRVDEVVGTALYMAPEQVAKQEITPLTDVYALGAVTYHCLAGRPPFEDGNALTVALRHLHEDPPPLPDHVPAQLRRIVETAMAKEPALRFDSAAALADAVDGGQTGAATAVLAARAAVPPTTEDQTPAPTEDEPRSRPRRRLAGAVLVLVAVLLAGLAIADPAGLIPRPGGPSPQPAATGDAEQPAGAEPSGDDPLPVSGVPATFPSPTGRRTARPEVSGTTPPAGAVTASPPGQAGEDPSTGAESPAQAPEPTSSPEPAPTETSAPDEGGTVAATPVVNAAG
ncbi:serine/threonine-protein kinase [Asanoa iriomotensis]|nr:serine/threonine-protein kinase [Asanoa iriomotensis]